MRYRELVGVYHAEGSLIGELLYVVGKLLGTTHCALCDITHGMVLEKDTFKACREALPAPLRTAHLDEQETELAAFTEGHTPCVVGRTEGGWELLLSREDLEGCHKDVATFDRLLRARITTPA